MEPPDFLHPSRGGKGLEVARVALREARRLRITGAKLRVAVGTRIPRLEEVKAQPAPVEPRHRPRLAEEGHEQREHEPRIHARLQLEIARVGLVAAGCVTALELQRRVQRMVDLLHEGDELADVVFAQPRPGIVLLELLDEPLRIVNANAKSPVRRAQECPRRLAQLHRLRAGQRRELPTAAGIDETILEIDPHARIRALEESLDLAEERLHPICGAGGASKWSRRSARSLSASRASRNPSDSSR
jgi:hypothetical protein